MKRQWWRLFFPFFQDILDRLLPERGLPGVTGAGDRKGFPALQLEEQGMLAGLLREKRSPAIAKAVFLPPAHGVEAAFAADQQTEPVKAHPPGAADDDEAQQTEGDDGIADAGAGRLLPWSC